MEFLIITGLSGGGKSQAADIIEDLDYYCVDNMPVALIPKFAELCAATKGRYEKVALVTDIREKNGGSIEDAILKETEQLRPIRDIADYIIDTSHLTLGQLHNELYTYFSDSATDRAIMVNVISFGFKYGMPLDADLVFDVRFLPNPFYVEDLKLLSGLDAPVRDYVFSFEQSNVFMDKLTDMIEYLLPLYIEEGKYSLTIAIGCPGGRHRSVAVASALAGHLKCFGVPTVSINRDINK